MSGRLLAVGDSHGCFRQLYNLVTEIIRLTREDKLVMLGDYIDRGEDSKAVLDLIMEFKGEGYDIIPLMGNHEDMMINAPQSPLDNYNWMLNGGGETLRSFGVLSVDEIDEKYMEFISGMKLYHIIDNFVFVHAGFNDEIVDPFEDRYSMLWERRFEYNSPVFKGKTIVHGHRPHSLSELKAQVKNTPPVINIDTGCVYGKDRGLGDLTAIDLLSMKLYTVDC
ncbi:MAG: serine/threonine protein phosphatase [Bacteroidales bacterium]|nr:serine/threonine protein phosphatase [Bacteroidales bacterium]